MVKRKKRGELPSGKIRRQVYVGIRRDGSRRYESFTGSNAAEVDAQATAFRLKVKQLLAAGIAPEDIPRDGDAPIRSNRDSVEYALDLYLETCSASHLSPSTLLSYMRIARRAYQALKPLLVSEISVPVIQQYANARALAGASAKTIRGELSLLACALRPSRPDLDMRLVRVPRQPRQEIAIPSTEEVQKLLTAAKGSPLFVPLLLAALMGLRRSEICGLTWADIDPTEHTLHVHAAVVRGDTGAYQRKATKTQAGDRVLSIPAPVLAALDQSRADDARVTKLTPDAITRRFERLLQKLGMHYRFHDLRHYHASVMISVGAPDKYIIADMGHASMDMVNRVYGHVMADRQRQIAEQMAKQAEAFTL